MKLKTKKTISKRVISVEFETLGFTAEENEILDAVGEPVIEYETVFNMEVISIEKKIRTGFKTKVKFNGESNIGSADKAADNFIAKIKDLLAVAMADAKDLYENIDDFDSYKEKEEEIEY